MQKPINRIRTHINKTKKWEIKECLEEGKERERPGSEPKQREEKRERERRRKWVCLLFDKRKETEKRKGERRMGIEVLK